MPFFCEAMSQLDFSAHRFNPLSLRLSTKVLQGGGRELSVSWGFSSSVSLEGFGFFAAMVVVNCVLASEASVRDPHHAGIFSSKLAKEEEWCRFLFEAGA